MRSISKKLKTNLFLQAEEAQFLGLDKVASDVKKQINSASVRDIGEDYIYTSKSLNQDIHDLLWKAAIRVQDYYEKTADIRDIDKIISDLSDSLISGIKKKMGGEKFLKGNYEVNVPGEFENDVVIDDSDE